MLEKVIENWTSRLDYTRASRGSPMPEIIFKICGDLRFLPVNFDKPWATTLHFTFVSTYHAKGTTCLLLKLQVLKTISEKKKVIESVEEGERKVDVAKAFEIPLSSLSTILKNKEKIFSSSSSRVRKRVSKGFPSPNLVDVDNTLTKFNAEPSLWEALPEQDLTFDDYVLVDTDIAVWGALSDAEIVALDHNNTECDEDESEELTPVTLSEAKVSLNKLRNFFLQNHVDADILQASFVLEKSIDKVRLNALKQKKITDFFDKKD
ncbi:tigger transposable element-derived protein 6 [Trichonephila clavipes]|nr:tigger transposable element-derived protein 6 [Trichonephila clavipes]